MYEDLILKYRDFDFASFIRELQSWQDGLGDTLEDEVTFSVLDGVKDILFDYCSFD